jgi:periplasmic nitrate reductase NapD
MAMPEPGTVHISSAVVHARPERTAALAGEIGVLDGADVHYAQGGKIIVTFEATDPGAITAQLNRIALLDGVFAATLVYHEVAILNRGEESPCS